MATRIKGITVEINGDTTGLSKALSKVNSNIKNTQSQLKDVEKLLKLDPTNTELLAQKQKLLAQNIDNTSEKLETLKTANEQAAKSAGNYDAWKEKYDPIKSEITKTQEKLKSLKEQAKQADEQLAKGEISQEKYDSLQNEIKSTSDELKALKQSAKDISKEFGNPVSPEQYNALQREIIETEQKLKELQHAEEKTKNATQDTTTEGKDLAKQLKEVGESSKKASGGISSIASSVSDFVGNLASEAFQIGIDKLKEFTISTIETGSELQSKMSGVVATLGYTLEELHNPTSQAAQDFEVLEEKAKEMGKTTAFSSSEAADAMNYMAMAGWDAQKQLAAIEPVMDLAAASGEDLALVSDIVTDSMTALGMGADEAGHYADILAAASSSANTNVALLGESFKYVAPVAGSMNASAEDLSIALGLMANAGIKGSQAGNSLKNALVNLTKPTEQQSEAMQKLGLIATETTRVFDEEAIQKAQSKVADKTAIMEKAQISYNSAVDKYGENSAQAQKALLSLQTAENHLIDAQDALTEAQQGTIETIAGQSVFQDEYGNVKSLGEIMDILRSTMGKVNVELTDSEGNMREYEDIIADLEQTEDGLTQAEQLKNAAIIFGKQNLAGMLTIINASEEDYQNLTDSIYNCEDAAKNMAEVKLDNLAGDVTLMQSAFSGLQESIFDDLDRPLRKIVQSITQQFLPALTNVIEGKSGAESVLQSAIIKLMTKLSVQMRNVMSRISEVMQIIISAVAKSLPKFVPLAVDFITGFVQNFISNLPLLIDAALLFSTMLITTLMQVLPELLPIAAQIISTLVNGIITYIPQLFGTTVILVSEFVKGIAGNLPKIVESALSLIMALTKGILQALPELLHILPGLVKQLADGLLTSIDFIVNAGLELFLALVDALPEIIEGIIVVIPDIITALVENILSNIPEIIDAGFRLITALIENSEQIINTIVRLAPQIVSAIIASLLDNSGRIWETGRELFSKIGEGIFSVINSARNWGADIIQNLVDGILSGIGQIAAAAESVGEMIWEYLHFSVPEKGPLTDFESWMPDFMTGLADGIRKNQKYVEKAVNSVAEAMQLTMDNDINYTLHGVSDVMTAGTSAGVVNNYYNTDNSQTFHQTNNSPKSLSRYDIYRQTNNILGRIKKV